MARKLQPIARTYWPVGAVFLTWVVLAEITDRGRRLSPGVIGSAGFQRFAALVLALTLAAGWLVALRRALRAIGRARLVNAALALPFAAICFGNATSHVWLGNMAWYAVARTRESSPMLRSPKVAAVFERAWTGDDLEYRESVARTIYELHGIRIVYRDEDDADTARLYEPPPELVLKNEERRAADESVRSTMAGIAIQAAHSVRVAYMYLVGVAEMLAGSLLLLVPFKRPAPAAQVATVAPAPATPPTDS
jgi:hypothetical protein